MIVCVDRKKTDLAALGHIFRPFAFSIYLIFCYLVRRLSFICSDVLRPIHLSGTKGGGSFRDKKYFKV